MSHDRNFGVTGAGLGLTAITGLLIALGFLIVQRLGGPGAAPPVEVRPSQPSAMTDAEPRVGPAETVEQPQVLEAEQPEASDLTLPHTAQRPQWLPYEDELEEAPTPGIDGLLTPLSPDQGESLWPPVKTDEPSEDGLPEPFRVR